MTKEQYENQQWYKNMPVLIKGIDQSFYVKGVDFELGRVQIGAIKEYDRYSSWYHFSQIFTTYGQLDEYNKQKEEK